MKMLRNFFTPHKNPYAHNFHLKCIRLKLVSIFFLDFFKIRIDFIFFLPTAIKVTRGTIKHTPC